MAKTKWEISIMELKDSKGKKYKVTRRMPEMSISETKVFRSKKKALQQFNEWIALSSYPAKVY